MKRKEFIKLAADKLTGRLRPFNIEDELNEVLIEFELLGMLPPKRHKIDETGLNSYMANEWEENEKDIR